MLEVSLSQNPIRLTMALTFLDHQPPLQPQNQSQELGTWTTSATEAICFMVKVIEEEKWRL